MKIKPKATFGIDAYAVVSRAVEEGVAYGWWRVLKYHEGDKVPADNVVQVHVETAVMNALCEVVKFDDVRDEE